MTQQIDRRAAHVAGCGTGDLPLADRLLAWYDRSHRHLPWRVSPGDRRAGIVPDPYRVWLSEIMLQQTTVASVKSYYETFLRRWPDIGALAAAHVDDVMKAWAGLGYYSRARNLKKCAETVAGRHAGIFPDTVARLKELPGIGDYTAAAIAAIAHDRPVAVVDGNVERVVARLAAIATPLPAAKPAIRAFVEEALSRDRPGDFAQATMDLGATICTPRRPACILCPLAPDCQALAAGTQEAFPVKPAKTDKPQRQGAAFVAVRADGAVLLRQRRAEGLLGGMSEVPGSAWNARIDGSTGLESAPFAADWKKCGAITHTFTHFRLTLSVYRAEIPEKEAPPGHWWSMPAELAGEALPTVMKKAIEAAIEGATKKQQQG